MPVMWAVTERNRRCRRGRVMSYERDLIHSFRWFKTQWRQHLQLQVKHLRAESSHKQTQCESKQNSKRGRSPSRESTQSPQNILLTTGQNDFIFFGCSFIVLKDLWTYAALHVGNVNDQDVLCVWSLRRTPALQTTDVECLMNFIQQYLFRQ